MHLKPFVFGVAIAATAETIVHKEHTTPHPVEDQIQQDPISRNNWVAQMSGVNFYRMPDGSLEGRIASEDHTI